MFMDDKKLVELILAGERQAFEQLIKRYQRLVAHVVFRLVDDHMDREEVAQDVFIKVYEKIGEFNFQSKLSTWIATIAYRHAINFLKKNKRYQESEDLENTTFHLAEEDRAYEKSDFNLFVQQAVTALPSPYKAILTFYHLEGFSYQEIMEVMDMPEGTVKNYLFRARKKLKDILEPYLEKETLLH